MPKAIIKIAYRQVIDSASNSVFEKNVFHASYEEYKMKQQAYNPDGSIVTFSALKAKDGRANSLHYKSGFAVAGIVETLRNKITVIQDKEEVQASFDIYRFEILESDLHDMSKHRVAIHYITKAIILFEIMGDYLLVAAENNTESQTTEAAETFFIKVQPGMTICSYKEIKN